MVLRLDPPELGKLRVDVEMHNRVLTVQFHAETQAGHQALQNRLVDLRSALEQHGIQLDRVDVEFRPPATPTDESRDTQDQPQYRPQEEESAAHKQQERHSQGNQTPGSQADADPTRAEQAMDMSWTANEADEELRPAETGVDLIM